jgi:hypothetical protein
VLNDHLEFNKDLSAIKKYKISKKGGNLNE